MPLVGYGTQAQVTAASSVSPSSTNATAGNTLVLLVAWIDTSSAVATALAAPSGWTAAHNPTGYASSATGTQRGGFAVFYKSAAGGVESPVVNTPGSAGAFYANAIIAEGSGWTFDSSASSPATILSNSAASTSGVTVPNTGTLAASSSYAFTGVSILAGAGLTNAGIAFSGGSWTVRVNDQNTSVSVGTLTGDKSVSGTAAINAVYTWTSDSTMQAYQASVVVFSDSGAPPTVSAQPEGKSAALNASATYSVTSPDATSYQWQVSTDGGASFANVASGAGATSATYSTPPAQASDNGKRYRCVLSSSGGSTNSASALFTVSGLPATITGRRLSEGWSGALLNRIGVPNGMGIHLLRAKLGVYCCKSDNYLAWQQWLLKPAPTPSVDVDPWTFSSANRPGSGPLSRGAFFVSRPMIWAPAATGGAIALAAAAIAAATLTASLSTQIRPAAAIQGQALSSAALSTQIPLQCAAIGGATCTAALSTAVTPACSAAGDARATAALTTAIAPAAAAAARAQLDAALATSIAPAVAARGHATVGATLSTSITPAVTAQGQATATSALVTQIPLLSAAFARATLLADLAPASVIAASAYGDARATAALTTAIAPAASAAARAQLDAALVTSIAPTAAARGHATIGATLSTSITPAVTAQGQATATSVLVTQIPLLAAAFARATLLADLAPASVVAASAYGDARATAALTTAIAPVAAARGHATVDAPLSTSIAPATAARGYATVSAALATQIAPQAAAIANALSSAALVTQIPLAAFAQARATLTAALPTADTTLQAFAYGRSVASAALSTSIRMAAAARGETQLTALLASVVLFTADGPARIGANPLRDTLERIGNQQATGAGVRIGRTPARGGNNRIG